MQSDSNSVLEVSKKTPEPPYGRLLVEGEEVALRIEERFREEAVVPTAAQMAREKREYGEVTPQWRCEHTRPAAPE